MLMIKIGTLSKSYHSKKLTVHLCTRLSFKKCFHALALLYLHKMTELENLAYPVVLSSANPELHNNCCAAISIYTSCKIPKIVHWTL